MASCTQLEMIWKTPGEADPSVAASRARRRSKCYAKKIVEVHELVRIVGLHAHTELSSENEGESSQSNQHTLGGYCPVIAVGVQVADSGAHVEGENGSTSTETDTSFSAFGVPCFALLCSSSSSSDRGSFSGLSLL